MDSKDKNARTSLIYASVNGHAGAVGILLGAGAVVDAKDNTGVSALMCASTSGHEGAVRVLLRAGAAVDLKDSYDRTALMFVSQSGHVAAARALLEAGAVVDSRNGIAARQRERACGCCASAPGGRCSGGFENRRRYDRFDASRCQR